VGEDRAAPVIGFIKITIEKYLHRELTEIFKIKQGKQILVLCVFGMLSGDGTIT
jgi:hypothetical protein